MQGGKIAGFVFTVIVPLVVAAMIPHITAQVGFPLIALSVVIGLADWAWSFSPLPWRQKVGPILLMSAGLLAFSGGAIWFYFAHRSPEHPAVARAQAPIPRVEAASATSVIPPRPPQAPPHTAQQDAAAGPALLVQCFPDQPRTVPSDGRVNLLKLVNIDGPMGGYRSGMVTQWAEPGSPVVLAETVFSVLNWDGMRCELTNYGREPLQDIRLILSVEYHEAEKLENGFRMGPLKKRITCPVELEAIGAGQPARRP